jgi:hypothetical protein
MGSDTRANVLPAKTASGPGFLGPNYNPADEMLPPASVGVRRGDSLESVLGAVKGIIYYGDMIGFGKASSRFTSDMPGIRPLGVNYFVNSGLTCSNGAAMWEYVQTIPTGGALGQGIKKAIEDVGLPGLRGMAPGILEDAQFALDPFPVINAVVGSGYPICKLVNKPVGDYDGKIYNVDGVLLVDPIGLTESGGKYFQERWIQDRKVEGPNRRNEDDDAHFARSNAIQISYDEWKSTPKTHKDNGCVADPVKTPGLEQPSFCSSDQGFQDYRAQKHPVERMISLTVAAISIFALVAFWTAKSRK